jgi:hypothetical protein
MGYCPQFDATQVRGEEGWRHMGYCPQFDATQVRGEEGRRADGQGGMAGKRRRR